MGLNVKRKKMGFKRFLNSFKYSCAGFKFAFLNEQSMVIHVIMTLLVIIFGFVFHISVIEWLFCVTMFGLVMASELINTSIEAVVDMTMPDIHPLAKIAKDTASAAVFVFSVVAFIIGVIIFFPKFYEVIVHLL